MSLLNNAVVPMAVVGLYGLAFVLGVGHYSQEQTAAHLRQIEQHRAEAEVVRRSEETTPFAGIECPSGRCASAASPTRRCDEESRSGCCSRCAAWRSG